MRDELPTFYAYDPSFCFTSLRNGNCCPLDLLEVCATTAEDNKIDLSDELSAFFTIYAGVGIYFCRENFTSSLMIRRFNEKYKNYSFHKIGCRASAEGLLLMRYFAHYRCILSLSLSSSSIEDPAKRKVP